MERFTVNEIEMACLDRGLGMPVVLVHGFPLDQTMWESQIEALGGEFRVIAPDLRGYGESELGEVDPADGVTMERYADDLNAMLDAMEITEPIVLCGFSMGGYILWQFVQKYGERIRALILCDTKASADTDDAKKMRLKMANHIDEWGTEKVAQAMKPKLFAEATLEERPEIVERMISVIHRTNPQAIAAAQRGMAARPDMSELLRELLCPVLVIVGEEDVLTSPAEMEFIAGQIPGSLLQRVPEAGHMAPVEQPEIVTAAMQNFLRQIR